MEQRPHLDLSYYGRWAPGIVYIAEVASKEMGVAEHWHRHIGQKFVELVAKARDGGCWVYDAFDPNAHVAALPENASIYDAFVSYDWRPSDNIRSTVFMFGEHSINKPFLEVPTLLIIPSGGELYDQYGTPIEKLDPAFCRVHSVKAITADKRFIYQFGRSTQISQKAA